jgi:hypothetical protein
MLKSGSFKAYFVSDPESPFYTSGTFRNVIGFIQQRPKSAKMSEKNGKLSVTFSGVHSVDAANKILEDIRSVPAS